MKEFLEWIGLKARLHNAKHRPPFVSEGDIWWAGIGENVGWEINGKSELFTRPVIVLKKLAHGFYFVIPATTKPQHGSWYVNYRHGGITAAACLHQARSIDYRRLFSKIGALDQTDYDQIKAGFRKPYG